MSQFIKYSEIDGTIQNRMSGQAPSETKRLEAINDSVQELYSEYDIQSGIRNFIANLVPNGKSIDISDFISDYKKIKDIRYLSNTKHIQELEEIEDDIFEVHIGQRARLDEYTANWNNGKVYLKLNSRFGSESLQIHSMGSIADDGTWTADSDVSGLTTTKVTTLNQAEAIRFDVDVSASANNYAMIYNADFNAVEMQDYINLGKFQFWTYIPSVTEFTSVELRWGSSAAAYWSAVVTKQADGSALIAGWNFVEVDWADASETGTVDEENIDYLAVKFNYTASYTDQSNFVVEAINLFLPVPYKVVYYTYFNSQQTDGTFQEALTTTATDEIVIPRRFKELLINKALQLLWPMSAGDDGVLEVKKLMSKETKLKVALSNDIGDKPKVPTRKIKIRI